MPGNMPEPAPLGIAHAMLSPHPTHYSTHTRPTALLLTLIAAAHVPLFLFLIHKEGAFLGHLRAMMAAGALALLLYPKKRARHWSRVHQTQQGRFLGNARVGEHFSSPERSALGSLLIPLSILSLLGALVWLGLGDLRIYLFSLPLCAMALRHQRLGGPLWEHLGIGVLALLIFPFESFWGPTLDPLSQNITADLAAVLVQATGLQVDVHKVMGADPVLVAEHLRVTVNRLCAGSQTLLTIITLGTVIAEMFLRTWRVRVAFIVGSVLFGFSVNIMRVALSTHAARIWGHNDLDWAIAHDAIGYGAFVGGYGALFLMARWIQRRPAAPAKTLARMLVT